ncbi:MAG: EFR1 family ferrodoxin [Clostridiales bacterium]|nr:EFR1 family ferrodoxin [Clostridiales bacterium]
MANERNIIFYFSGTGNCYSAAVQVASALGEAELHRVTRKFAESVKKEKRIFEADRVVVIFPAYAYGLPSLMYGFFRNLKVKAEYTAFVVSRGTKHGAAITHAKAYFKGAVQACFDVKSIENFVPIFGLPTADEVERGIEEQRGAVEAIAKEIEARKSNRVKTFHPLFGIVSRTFRVCRPLLNLSLRITKDCVRCGRCEKICPGGAIKSRDGLPPKINRWKCQSCQGCINVCPKRAVAFAGIKKNGARYIHPDFRKYK